MSKLLRPLMLLVFAAMFAANGSHFTQAAKPGGTGGGTVPAGRIYFSSSDIGVGSMNADGTNPLPEPLGVPSHQLHDGHRWFLTTRETPELGNYPPQGPEGAIWPREEVFAVRDDGLLAVRLTDDPNVKPLPSHGHLRWGHDDSFISLIGVQWDGNGTERGVICRAALAFIGGTPMLVEAPTVWMDSGVNGGGVTYPDFNGHDWSPAGDQLVFGEVVGGDIWPAGGVFPEIHVTTFGLPTGPATAFLDYGKYPEWSLQGRIAYTRYDTAKGNTSGVWTTAGDGGGTIQVTGGADYFPAWSADGTQLAFTRAGYTNKGGTRTYFYDVMEAPATGGTAVNLTSKLDGGFWVVWGWRSN